MQMNYNNTAPNKNNMGRGVSLTEEEKGKIAALSMVEASTKKIARPTGKSKKAVQNNLKSPATYGVKESPGRPRKMTPALKRRLQKAASDGAKISTALRQSLNLPHSWSTVHRALNSSGKYRYKKKMYAPLLTAMHKQNKFLCAHKHETWSAADW